MCGIVGMVAYPVLDREAVAPRLGHAIQRLAPRGPDGAGTWFDDRCGLGHTRLAIIDLSPAGAQPMARHGGVISYNGEIYNYMALRDELAGLGYRFESRSDTEVLLAGWRQWREGLFPRLNGMFAFALWDPGAGELVMARDRFGKKPLLYRDDGNRLLFASDLVALERLAGTSWDLDPKALRLLFSLRFIPEPQAAVKGVRKLLAGHWARFSAAGLHVRRWAVPLGGDGAPYRDPAAAAADLRRRFDAATAARLVADVPVGAFLSGGIDSAVVAAAMVASGRSVRTFTVGFPAGAFFDERPAARRVARHLGTEHREIELAPAEVRAGLEAAFAGFDEPFGDPSGVPTFLLCRAVWREVKVALSGDGGDETFGGYRKYLGELLARRYRRWPRWLREGVVEPLARSLPGEKGRPVLETLRRVRRFVEHAGKDTLARQAGWARLLTDGEIDGLLRVPAEAESIETLLGEAGLGGPESDPINALLRADQAFSLTSQMLVKADRMSMAASLEVRAPFLDPGVAACANAMPGTFKVAGGRGKRILERAFADRLPAEVFARPKRGFDPPVAAWLTGELADFTRRAVDPARLKRQGLFDPSVPSRWHADLVDGRRDTSDALWTLVAFQAWWERRAGE